MFDTYSIALSELAEIPFELNSLNLLHKFLASLGFFFTLSNKLDWLKTGYKELEHKIGRLERSLRVKTETDITFALLRKWIKSAQEVSNIF